MPQIQSESRTVTATALRNMAHGLLVHAGLSNSNANLVADTLVESNLRGIDSHGTARLLHYLNRIEQGSIDSKAKPQFEKQAPAMGMVDGQHGLGQLAMMEATNRAADLAHENGCGWVAVKNSSHCGALAYYGQHLANQGMVAVVFTHSDAMVAPYAAKHAFCGTNPICIVIPGQDAQHLCLDMATSCVPWNTVMNAAIEGVKLHPDWALDANGTPTTDPHLAAAVRPTAGYKGSGLGLIIDLLCALPGGGPIGPDIPKMFKQLDQQRRLGGLVGAIDLTRFQPLKQMTTRTREIADRWNHQPCESPDNPTLWPGQPELNCRQKRLKNGIPMGVKTLAQLEALATQAGVTW